MFDSFVIERINNVITFDNRKIKFDEKKGAMGMVFPALESATGFIMAVKTIKTLSANPGIKDIFRNEAKIMLTIEPHPNVTSCFVVTTLFGIPEFCHSGK